MGRPAARCPSLSRRLILIGVGLIVVFVFASPPDFQGFAMDNADADDVDALPSANVAMGPLPVHDDNDDDGAAVPRAQNFSSLLAGANVIVRQEVVQQGELFKLSHTSVLRHPHELTQFPPRARPLTTKYFAYQPSGGWGNQRYILRWAMIAANAMKRTLLVAPIAPHSDIWHGFNEFNKSDLCSAALVLDVRAMQEAVDFGVVFLDDLPIRAVEAAKDAGLSVKVYTKPHYKGGKNFWRLFESRIAQEWGDEKADVVFWDKGSMWMCCLTEDAADSVWFGRHIMFNARLKATARVLAQPLGLYNAVHVRRGDHALNDRRTAERYYKLHNLGIFDKKLPLYIATDEQYHGWFRYFRKKGKFSRLVFWSNLDRAVIADLLDDFPKAFHPDALGFLEQLICGNAVQWEGSRESTFSAAISTIRMVPALRNVNWSFPVKPSIRKKLQPLSAAASSGDLNSVDGYDQGGEPEDAAGEET